MRENSYCICSLYLLNVLYLERVFNTLSRLYVMFKFILSSKCAYMSFIFEIYKGTNSLVDN